jgi:hypothetical protein
MNITIVSVSVNYIDYLELTYKYNKNFIDNKNYHIITSNKDIITKNFCFKNKINCWTTDIFYYKNSFFNKGAVLNSFFENIKTIPKIFNNLDWILLLDSDIIINKNIQKIKFCIENNCMSALCNSYVDSESIKDYLYSCRRRVFLSKEDLENGLYYETEPKVEFIGYFQLFHISKIKKDLDSNKIIFNEYSDASEYDSNFRDKYWRKKEMKPLNFYVDHLGPIANNWAGRKSKAFV